MKPIRVLLAASCLLPALARADEGQWMPEQIAQLDPAGLRAMGLQLAPQDLWNEGGGLLRAAIRVSGCSAGFVSPKGLIATNHHCAYQAIQGQSTVERDHLTRGFLARALGEELQGKGLTAQVIDRITDVTAELRAVADSASDDPSRALAVERRSKELVQACEQAPGYRCQVADFYAGSQYRLFRTLEIRDVRIVYAPPAGIGEYGGEIDNWMWPRHTGDFTLLRAYVGKDGKPAEFSPDNVPYAPAHFLSVADEGVPDGGFVAVLGYPGRTNRYLPAPEVARWLEQVFPARMEVYGEWITAMQRLGEGDPAVKIKVAARVKSLANRRKNAEGQIEGLRRNRIVDRRHAEDASLRAIMGAAPVLEGLERLSAARRAGFARDFLLENVGQTGGTLAIAIDLVRRAREIQKPDLERVSEYMTRNEAALRKALERRVRDFDARVDATLLGSWLGRMAALPEPLRIQGLPAAAAAEGLVRKTAMDDGTKVGELFAAPERVARTRDPLLAIAEKIVVAIEAMEAEGRARDGALLTLGPRYFELVRTARKGPVYPDANGTLRVSFATVAGYAPREGLWATPRTTLQGAVAKHTGVSPFDLPRVVIDRAVTAASTHWVDPVLGDVPVCFLASGDTTGGNSGSPVIDGRGRLVGLNFDRVWENVAGDFGYDLSRSRNVVVDVRYLLWLLDAVEDAGALLAELGVAEVRGTPPPRPPSAAPTAAPPPSITLPPTASARGCRIGDPGLVWAVLAFALAWPRRSRQPKAPASA